MTTRVIHIGGNPSALLALVLAGAWLAAQASEPALTEVVVETRAGLQHRFVLEVADTEAARQRGLMFRESIPADGGMLFDLREERSASIWMKDTPLSLDVLFVRADGRVVRIAPSLPPMTLTPIASPHPVRAVIEINGGTCERLGITAGDRVHHAIFAAANGPT